MLKCWIKNGNKNSIDTHILYQRLGLDSYPRKKMKDKLINIALEANSHRRGHLFLLVTVHRERKKRFHLIGSHAA